MTEFKIGRITSYYDHAFIEAESYDEALEITKRQEYEGHDPFEYSDYAETTYDDLTEA